MKSKLIASSLGAIAFLAAQVTVVPIAEAAQSFTCTGSMKNGWNFTANYANGRFTDIRWTKPRQPPLTTELTYTDVNNAGQPYYTGSFQGAVAVRLVDLSGGNVKPGSAIDLSVEEWGNAKGTCGTGSAQPPVNQSNRRYTCSGAMRNGWNFAAQFVKGKFTYIRWTRPGQPPQTTELTYMDINVAGQPYYAGSFQGATTVRLVDLSSGNVAPGSGVDITVEEWGSAMGTCRPSP